ncbi:MAG TPA: hypothetical protein DIT64_07330 [Verrucomicrobiales bacterium]|nr:hypothetical protein [Verrucomicrobiales bacterium]
MKKILLTAALMLCLQGAVQAAPARLFASNLGNGIAPSNGLVGISTATVRFGYFPDAYDFSGKTFAQLNADFTQVAQSTAPLFVDGQRGFFDLDFDYETGSMDGKKIHVWILNGATAATAPQQAVFSTSQTFVTPDGIFPNHSFVSPDTGVMDLVAHVGDLADGADIGGAANAHTTVGDDYRVTDATASRTPEDEVIFQGTAVTFTAIADSSFNGIKYQWRLNGKNISKANSETLVIPSVTTKNTGNYDCVVTDDTVVVTTNVVPLQVLGIKPTFTMQPVSDVVAIGSAITLNALAVSPNGVNYQWKNKASLPGATDPQIEIANARPDDAGPYICVATNAAAIQGGGSTNSLVAEVVVIDVQTREIGGPVGGTVKINAIYFGKAARFQWKRNGVDLTNGGQFSGVTTKSLGIKGLTNGNDGDVYTCQIFAGNAVAGFDSLESGDFNLSVFNGAPTFTTVDNLIVLPPATIGQDYTPFQIPANGASLFAVSGLPKGMVCHPQTGFVSGRPMALNKDPLVPFNLTITITNGKDKVTRPATILVNNILANLNGAYTAWIARSTFSGGYSHTNNLGGRIDMLITTLGSLSGNLFLGDAKPIKFTGFLNNPGAASPTATILIRRPGLNFVPLEFVFTIQTPDNGDTARKVLSSAVLRDAFLVPGQTGIRSTTVTGWRRKFDSKNPTATFPGIYNVAVTASGDSATRPKGATLATLTIKPDGSVTIVGTTGDGEKITGSTFVGPTGQVLLFNLLYTPLRGSIVGNLQLNPGDAVIKDTVGGTLTWRRPANTSIKTRAYAASFNLASGDLTIAGGRYAITDKNRRILDLAADTAALLEFSDAGLSPANTPARPDINVTLQAGNKVQVNTANPPRLTKLVVNAAKGIFSGTFTYDGVANKTVKFQGHVIRNGGEMGSWEGFGWFMLTQVPGTTTSPVQSGLVTLGIP